MSILTWAITVQTQAQQNAQVTTPEQKCESPYYTRRAAEGEETRFNNDPLVQNFYVMRQVNSKALAEVVKSGDKSLVPYLEYDADVHDNPSALAALIKLGDDARFNKLVSQTRCVEGAFDGSDYTRQRQAIEMLVYLKTPTAYQVLYDLLDDTSSPPPDGDGVFLSRSQLVINYLTEAVNPLPAGFPIRDEKIEPQQYGALERQIWKKWFKTNKLVP